MTVLADHNIILWQSSLIHEHTILCKLRSQAEAAQTVCKQEGKNTKRWKGYRYFLCEIFLSNILLQKRNFVFVVKIVCAVGLVGLAELLLSEAGLILKYQGNLTQNLDRNTAQKQH